MSKDGLTPYAPLDVPKAIADDIWIVDGSVIRFGVGAIEAPFTTRMTVVRLPGGKLWLHSPVEPNDALFSAVTRLGTVSYLIAPNPIHYWWIADWAERFPGAEVHAVEQLAGHAKRPLPPFDALGQMEPAGWAGEIDQLLVEAGWFSEAIFFHRASRTLILVDLIENFELPRVRSWLYRSLIRLGGVADPDGKCLATCAYCSAAIALS